MQQTLVQIVIPLQRSSIGSHLVLDSKFYNALGLVQTEPDDYLLKIALSKTVCLAQKGEFQDIFVEKLEEVDPRSNV